MDSSVFHHFRISINKQTDYNKKTHRQTVQKHSHSGAPQHFIRGIIIFLNKFVRFVRADEKYVF